MVGRGVLVGRGVFLGRGVRVGAGVLVGVGVQVGMHVGVSVGVGVGVACATDGTCVVSVVTEDVEPNCSNPLLDTHQIPTMAMHTTATIAAPMPTIKVVCLGIAFLRLGATFGLSRWVTSDVPAPAGGRVGCS